MVYGFWRNFFLWIGWVVLILFFLPVFLFSMTSGMLEIDLGAFTYIVPILIFSIGAFFLWLAYRRRRHHHWDNNRNNHRNHHNKINWKVIAIILIILFILYFYFSGGFQKVGLFFDKSNIGTTDYKALCEKKCGGDLVTNTGFATGYGYAVSDYVDGGEPKGHMLSCQCSSGMIMIPIN